MSLDKVQMHIIKLAMISSIVTCEFLTAGCGLSWFSSRDTNPIIQDYAVPTTIFNRSTNIFATTASRRLVVVTEARNANSQGTAFLTCAEPPPDVGEAFAFQVAAGLQAAATATQGTNTKVSAELAAQYGRAVATQIAPLLYRTQGLQLYRDSMYKLCLDRMNGWIEKQEYEQERINQFDKAAKLISEELPIAMRSVEGLSGSTRTGEAKINVNDFVRIIEAVKSKIGGQLLESQPIVEK